MAKTVEQKKRELDEAGYDGPTDSQSIVDAWQRTATPEDRAADAGLPPPAPARTTTTSQQDDTEVKKLQVQQAMQAAQLADQQAQRALAASTAANAQDFAEKVREFNEQHDLALKQFGLSEAGITGTYNGQPTEAAKEFQ